MKNSSVTETVHIPTSRNEVEESLATLNADSSFVVSVDPSNLVKTVRTPMLESSLIQWMSTCWSLARNDSFEMNQVGEVEKQMKYLASSAPGAVLALFPAGKLKAVNRRTAATFRKQFFDHQSRWPDLAVSDSAFLLCVDSYPKDGIPSHLYSDQLHGQVTDWDGFRCFVDKLINSVVDESKIRGEILSKANNISTIFFELFKNTHDHARQRVDRSVIGESVRGIYSRFYPVEDFSDAYTKMMESPESMDALGNYLGRMMKPTRENRRGSVPKRDLSGFLELSVFDTGPGMAAKWLGREVSSCDAKEQYEAIINCLHKGNSSSTERGRGFGLWRVLQEISSIKGFIRIRSNNVHVFRQYEMLEKLHMQQHLDGRETPLEKFFDWRKQYSTTLSEYPHMTGTLISVMLPLGEL